MKVCQIEERRLVFAVLYPSVTFGRYLQNLHFTCRPSQLQEGPSDHLRSRLSSGRPGRFCDLGGLQLTPARRCQIFMRKGAEIPVRPGRLSQCRLPHGLEDRPTGRLGSLLSAHPSDFVPKSGFYFGDFFLQPL